MLSLNFPREPPNFHNAVLLGSRTVSGNADLRVGEKPFCAQAFVSLSFGVMVKQKPSHG